jgi:hypothetical protein
MTKRHWITSKECKEMYGINYVQLKNLVKHKVVDVKTEEKTAGRGRPKNLFNHKQVKVYGVMSKGERRNYMSKLNGTKLGKPKQNRNDAPSYDKAEFHITPAKSYGDFDKKYRYIDGVDKPKHYNPGKIEVIDAIDDWGLNFSAGNVVKYLVRAGRKGNNAKKKDLQKALWYLRRILKDD